MGTRMIQSNVINSKATYHSLMRSSGSPISTISNRIRTSRLREHMKVVVKIRRGRVFTCVYSRYCVTMNLPSNAKKISRELKVRIGNYRQTYHRLYSICLYYIKCAVKWNNGSKMAGLVVECLLDIRRQIA